MTSERGVVCPILIGREGPIDAARAVLERARTGTGGILIVAGEAGIGKSRLLRELAAEARRQHFLVLEGSCFEADRTIPYAPILDLVRGFSASASPAVAAHALAPAAPELVRAFPELGRLFPDLPALESLGPEQERRRLFSAVAETVALLSLTQPVVLAVEDLHWGDEASLDLYLHLARRLAAQPVVLAFSYRTDEVGPRLGRLLAELDRTRLVTEIELGRFSAGELDAMLSAIFDGAAPGDGFAQTLHELTEGNPFFVEEVLKSLVTAGDVARRADGSWHARPLARIEAPRTAVEAVRRRLSGLTVPARELASVAAVSGRRFEFGLLRSVTGHDEGVLLALIRELIAAQLVTEESPDRFAFRHALTREAIVGELMARERVSLHRAIADALELGGSSDAHIESLAYHAYEAKDWIRALTASTRAAEHALGLHAPREALAQFDRALDAAAQAGVDPDSALRSARGRARETLGDLSGAHDDFTAALEASRRDARAADAWGSLHALGMLWAARDYARAGEYRREALALAREIGDESMIARSLNRVANWHVNLEQPGPARRSHEEALALFERLGDQRGIAETVDLLAMTHLIAGDMATSAAHYERAVALHERIGERRALSSALALLCICDGSLHTMCTAFGRTTLAAATIAGDRPVRLAREIGWRAGEAFALYVVSSALAWRGAYDRALPHARQALALAEEMEHLQWECAAACALGEVLLELEAPEAARPALERALAIARRLGSHTWTRWSAAPLGVALARLGEFHAARGVLDAAAAPALLGRDALRPGDEGSPTLGERYLALAYAELALAEGDPARALEIADERLAAERAAGGTVPRLTFVRARALLALDDLPGAEGALAEARAGALSHDAPPLLWRVRFVTGQLLRRQRRRADARRAFDEARALAYELAQRISDAEWRASFERAIDALIPAPPPPTKRQSAKAAFGGLTRRERDVARLIAQGKSNRGIAKTLGIGERTVEGYVAAGLSKLGFTSRAQLAAWAVGRGLEGPAAEH